MILSKIISKEILKSRLNYLNCYLPIYKPPGISSIKIREAIHDDLHNVLWMTEVSHGTIPIYLINQLDAYADGVLTFRFGEGLNRRRRMTFAENIYLATVELGLEHEHNNIDGEFIGRVNIDHLTGDDIREKLKLSLGVNHQKKAYAMPMTERIMDRSPNEVARIYNTLPRENCPMRSKDKRQMFECCHPKQISICMKLELLSYSKPHAQLRITCQGPFNISIFIGGLAEKLGTKASLVRMTRIKEGPIWINDLRLLSIHELNLEHYIYRIPSLIDSYKHYQPEMSSEQLELVKGRENKGKSFTKFI